MSAAAHGWRWAVHGDMQQLTEGHDTVVCLGRRQECGDPMGHQSDTRTANQPGALFAEFVRADRCDQMERHGSAGHRDHVHDFG